MWSNGLQRLIEAKVAAGKLALVEPVKTWGGFSAGGYCCAGCDEPISVREMHHRLVGGDGSVLKFHLRCHGYFDSARLGGLEHAVGA